MQIQIMLSIIVVIAWTVSVGIRPQWTRTHPRRVFAASVLGTALLPFAQGWYPAGYLPVLWGVLVVGLYFVCWGIVEIEDALQPAPSAPTVTPQPGTSNRVYPHAARSHVYAQRTNRYAGYRKINKVNP